jgi:Flp pilus assembly protein TadD
VNLAVALQRTGNLAAAEVELRAAAPLAHTVTGVVDVATNLGALLIDTGRAAEAIPVLDQGLRASPQETILLVNRSAALRILGRYPEAVEDGRRAVALRPDDPYTRSILGMALLATGDLEGGLAEVRAAGALDPGNPEFPVTEAIALARVGRRDEACATLRRARATTHVLPMPRNAVRAAAQLGCPIE